MIPDYPVTSFPAQPSSVTPLADYLDRPCPGTGPDHLVLPRSLAQSMPLRWQQSAVALLAELHEAYAHLGWPVYQVVACRWELLVDLDEDQLAAAGYIADIDADGELVYRDRADRLVTDAATRRVLVPVTDPIPPTAAGHVEPCSADWPGA